MKNIDTRTVIKACKKKKVIKLQKLQNVKIQEEKKEKPKQQSKWTYKTMFKLIEN